MGNARKWDPKSPAGAGGGGGGGPISTPVALTLTGTINAANPLRVDFSASASVPVPGLILRYSFGDGALADAPLTAGGIAHTYVSPGSYLAGVAAAAQPVGYNVAGDSVSVNISASVTE